MLLAPVRRFRALPRLSGRIGPSPLRGLCNRKVVATSGLVCPGGCGEDDRRVLLTPTTSRQRIIRWAKKPRPAGLRACVTRWCLLGLVVVWNIAPPRLLVYASALRAPHQTRGGINSVAPQFTVSEAARARSKLGVEAGCPLFGTLAAQRACEIVR